MLLNFSTPQMVGVLLVSLSLPHREVDSLKQGARPWPSFQAPPDVQDVHGPEADGGGDPPGAGALGADPASGSDLSRWGEGGGVPNRGTCSVLVWPGIYFSRILLMYTEWMY